MKAKTPRHALFHHENKNRISLRVALKPGFGVALAVIFLLVASTATKAFPQSDQSGIRERMVKYPSGQVTLDAYIVDPKSGGKHPAVIVVQSADGVSEKIRAIARDLANQGFIAFVPNLRSTASESTSTVPASIPSSASLQAVKDLKAAYEYLKTDDNVSGARISAVGLGWGAWRVFMLAEEVPQLHRVVMYYGVTPSTGLDKVKSPILAHYAQYDFRVTGNAVWTQNTLRASGTRFTYYIYPEANSGFMNNSQTPHDIEAAEVSWKRTLAFLSASH